MQYHSSYEKTAHLYDLFDQKGSIEFFCHYTRGVGEVLDIGAGTGRIAIPIAARGATAYCVEPSPAMRAVFIEKLSKHRALSGKINLIAGDAATFALKRRFPVAIMSGVFDHLLDDNTRLIALQNVSNHLEHDGVFVFDVFTGNPKESPLVSAGSYIIDSREYTRFVGSKMISKKMKEVRIIFEIREHGKLLARIEEKGFIGVVSSKRILGLLKKSGFTVTNEYSNFDYTRYKKGDDSLIIEARNKKAG